MMKKRKVVTLCAALCCLSLPLSACGDVALDATVERCQNALTAAQEQESITFSERWTLKSNNKTTVMAETIVSKSGDNWTRAQKDADNTTEIEYNGIQFQKTDETDWVPTSLTAYESFWTTLSLDDFSISEAVEKDGVITLTVEGEAAEDNDGGTVQLETLEFELNGDGSLRTCREILRLTSLDTEDAALHGTLTVEITVSDDDEESVSAEIDSVYEEAAEEYTSLLPSEEDAETE